MSKKSIDVFADKQYITQIGKEVMHFKFADGSPVSYTHLRAHET